MKKENLPNKISVFPLSSAIFFPRTVLPLNIFEKRYIQLVEDSMKSSKIFGMVQPKKTGKLNKPAIQITEDILFAFSKLSTNFQVIM